MTGRWQMIVALSLCVALFAANWTALDVAQQEISRDLDLTSAAGVWLIYLYPAALLGVLIPVKGRLGVLLLGLGAFGLASAAAAFAANGAMLIGCRAGQGLAVAIVLRAGFELTREHFRGTEWWPALVIPVVLAVPALIAGPLIGVVITNFLSFRWIFLINVPLTVVALVLVALFTPRTAPNMQARA
ncbi:MFS transporter [Nonomuraea angiospora]|uniref:MFS family permease n=1 Tax=Nonomuraea angiospora TaxID=46172 RepID=A0ABR9M0Q9_9ACTN|nr:MFS transporter [Nonomuraea angiospora]MBE1586489.1 MFS family permease [Nonomuraea angiospora]